MLHFPFVQFFLMRELTAAFALFFPGYSAKLASLLWGLKLPEERLQLKWPRESDFGL
jgi:hypothetical protein